MTGDDRTDGAFNVIIVGGGSAGAVLARRLSENSARTVLLLEAGETYAPDGYPDLNASRLILWHPHTLGGSSRGLQSIGTHRHRNLLLERFSDG